MKEVICLLHLILCPEILMLTQEWSRVVWKTQGNSCCETFPRCKGWLCRCVACSVLPCVQKWASTEGRSWSWRCSFWPLWAGNICGKEGIREMAYISLQIFNEQKDFLRYSNQKERKYSWFKLQRTSLGCHFERNSKVDYFGLKEMVLWPAVENINY